MMSRRGTSFIDLILSIAIIAILFGGIYLVYFSLVTAISNISVREAATSAVSSEIETIRNLPYASVGTVGGIPAGVIPQSQTVVIGNYSFNLTTTILNISDPFDTSNPPDTTADYKLVEIDATCPLCSTSLSIAITTTVASNNLDSGTQEGSLFLYALDANGNPISGATVQVVNASVTPSINLTDTTNVSGVLELVGVPTSSEGYQITVTKPGYSTDRTYPPGAAGNPNPVKPNATVAVQQVTDLTFSIDQLSTLNIVTEDDLCEAIPNESLSLQGSKLIGTSPNVLKFSTTTTTNASGTVTLPNIEWDTYTINLNDATKNIAGTTPLVPITINPDTTQNVAFILQPVANPSLLVTAVDAGSGAGLTNAAVTLSKTGFNETLVTGHEFVTQNDWSSGGYSSQSGGIDVNSTPNAITLLLNASGTYNTNTNDWLISNTFDLGGASSTLYTFSWSPGNTPSGTTATFQVAANNDNATWNFVGPDGTGGTFFTAATSTLPASLSGDRYIRYKVYLNTTNPSATPTVNDVTIEFNANCVPPSQVLFTSLPTGTYTVNVSAGNYNNASTSVVVGAGNQSTTVDLIPL